MPDGGWDKVVVEWNEPLRIPAVTSHAPPDDHTVHFYFDPSNREVALMLYRHRYVEEERLCLDLAALHSRSTEAAPLSFRLFEGAISDLVFPAHSRLGAARKDRVA